MVGCGGCPFAEVSLGTSQGNAGVNVVAKASWDEGLVGAGAGFSGFMDVLHLGSGLGCQQKILGGHS